MAVRRSDLVWLVLTLLALAGGVIVWLDVPVRLFGSHGGDRLAPVVAQSQARGCVPIVPITVEYAGRTIVHPIPIAPGSCVTVLAAGGEGMMHVYLDLFGPWGLRVQAAGPGNDVSVTQCAPPGDYRAEIHTAVPARVAWAAMACR